MFCNYFVLVVIMSIEDVKQFENAVMIRKRIIKSGTVHTVTIPHTYLDAIGVSIGDIVLVKIFINGELVWIGVKKIGRCGKTPAISLPNSKTFKKIWLIVHNSRKPIDIVIQKIQGVENVGKNIQS